ncbi:hypothetical protein SLE2022_220730 [Rubroshorea leprosula]
MASTGMATIPLNFRHFQNPRISVSCGCSCNQIMKHRFMQQNLRLRVVRFRSKSISAVGSGLEASVSDPDDNALILKDAKVTVESRSQNNVQVRVDLTASDTQKVFDNILADLARTAPPVPGFRRQKGGKTSKVPKSLLLEIFGEDRVTKFVIQEIASSTMADYVKKENLNVKDKKINTTQTIEELKNSFTPGNEFGFNVIIELQDLKTDGSSPSSSNL